MHPLHAPNPTARDQQKWRFSSLRTDTQVSLYPQLVLFTFAQAAAAIQVTWDNNVAHSCDIEGGDMVNEPGLADDCFGICYALKGKDFQKTKRNLFDYTLKAILVGYFIVIRYKVY